MPTMQTKLPNAAPDKGLHYLFTKSSIMENAVKNENIH